MWLDRWDTNVGEITFGGVKKERYSGDLVYAKAILDDVWEISIDGFQVGNETFCADDCSRTLIDSGTEYILGPADEVIKIHNLLGISTALPSDVLMADNTSELYEPNITALEYYRDFTGYR
ncbi:unnamed protein product, partial [Didymodactylos carnosus]